MPDSNASLKDAFGAILATYATARANDRNVRGHPVRVQFERAAAFLKSSPSVQASEMLRVKWSTGQGLWASVPWIAILDSRETTQTRAGVYVIYLFCADCSGVYLTLNQGTSGHEMGARPKKPAELRLRADVLRLRCQSLQRVGFDLTGQVELRTDATVPSTYEASTIVSKLYRKQSIPSDTELRDDLAALLETYRSIVDQGELVED